MAPAASAIDQVGIGRSTLWKSTAKATMGLYAEQGNLSAIPTLKSVTSFGNERSEAQCCTSKATVDMQMGQWPVIDLESVLENLEFCEGWPHLALEIVFVHSNRTSEHTNLMLGLASAYHLGHACCHGLIPRSGGGKLNQARVEVAVTIQITTPARFENSSCGKRQLSEAGVENHRSCHRRGTPSSVAWEEHVCGGDDCLGAFTAAINTPILESALEGLMGNPALGSVAMRCLPPAPQGSSSCATLQLIMGDIGGVSFFQSCKGARVRA
ncbi:hypothetical protein VPH35_034558 [Triticum aestivum]